MNQILAEGGFAPEWVMLRLPSFIHPFSFLLKSSAFNFDTNSDPWSVLEKKDSDLNQVINKIYLFFNRRIFEFLFFLFSLIFMQELDEPYRDKDIFDNLSFFIRSVLSFKNIRFVCSFWLILCPWISGNPNIFAEPDPGSQNVTDPINWGGGGREDWVFTKIYIPESNRALTSNSDFPNAKSLLPYGVRLWYFKIWLLDLVEFTVQTN